MSSEAVAVPRVRTIAARSRAGAVTVPRSRAASASDVSSTSSARRAGVRPTCTRSSTSGGSANPIVDHSRYSSTALSWIQPEPGSRTAVDLPDHRRHDLLVRQSPEVVVALARELLPLVLGVLAALPAVATHRHAAHASLAAPDRLAGRGGGRCWASRRRLRPGTAPGAQRCGRAWSWRGRASGRERGAGAATGWAARRDRRHRLRLRRGWLRLWLGRRRLAGWRAVRRPAQVRRRELRHGRVHVP